MHPNKNIFKNKVLRLLMPEFCEVRVLCVCPLCSDLILCVLKNYLQVLCMSYHR